MENEVRMGLSWCWHQLPVDLVHDQREPEKFNEILWTVGIEFGNHIMITRSLLVENRLSVHKAVGLLWSSTEILHGF